MKPELYYPVKSYKVNQAFGLNLNSAYKQAGLKGHPGEDLFTTHGQPIYASHDGTCYPTVDDHGGNGIILQADPEFKNYFTIYWHLIDDDAVVHTGQKVKAGDLLGYADSTGISTGDHLHFGLSIYENIDYNNGFQGHIDPQPFYNGKYAEEINNPVPIPSKFQFTKTLKINSWNAEVQKLQALLNGQNGSSLILDGVFGVRTDREVKVFQLAHSLLADGIIGTKSRAVLNTLI